MASHTGSGPRLALHLLLLCGMGALLSSHPVPMSDRELGDTIKELQFLSAELLKNYVQKEKGLVPPQLNFTSYCETPRTINSSAILPYFNAIQTLSSDNEIDLSGIIDYLDKLKPGPGTEVLLPDSPYQRKCFILAVLEEFSACMKSLSLSVQTQS